MNRNLKALKFVYDFSIHRFLIFKTKKNVLISLFHRSFHRKPSCKASLFSVYFVINYLRVTTIQPFLALMRYFYNESGKTNDKKSSNSVTCENSEFDLFTGKTNVSFKLRRIGPTDWNLTATRINLTQSYGIHLAAIRTDLCNDQNN